jgi:hypothetical protein
MKDQQDEPRQGERDCQIDAALLPPAYCPYLEDKFLQSAGCDLQFADGCSMQQNNCYSIQGVQLKTEPRPKANLDLIQLYTKL